MKDTSEYLLDYADAEFDGDSWNGDSLMKTLAAITPEEAFDTRTKEGYSAWSVAVHLAYYKHFVAKAFLGEGAVGPFPWEVGKHEFGLPIAVNAEAWAALLAYLVRFHRLAVAAIRAASPERLAETRPGSKTSLGELAGWYLSHDSYHIGQIRSMGTPGI